MATLNDIIDSERYERAVECCKLEHFEAAIESDQDDNLIDGIMAVDGVKMGFTPASKDPFFESMDANIEDTFEEEVERILDADHDMTYLEMVGII